MASRMHQNLKTGGEDGGEKKEKETDGAGEVENREVKLK